MFSSLKKAFSKFTEKISTVKSKKVEAKPKVEKAKDKKTEKLKVEKPKLEVKKEKKPEEKKSFFVEVTKFITEVKITDDQFEKIFSEFEVDLLQNNVAYEVVEEIKKKLKGDLVGKQIKRKEIDDKIKKDLRGLILRILDLRRINLEGEIKKKKPYVVLFIGVNGVGKTTTLAKVAKWLLKKKYSVVFSASDTFRSASIEQLESHANKLGIKMIKHKYGADPGAVAYDAIEYAKSKNLDVVLIDTAGRSHANVDLMRELEKVKRVSNADLTILTVDSLTGNDAVEQAKLFDEKIGIDGSILTKTDADEKGGALISVAYVTKKPIMFVGLGQKYEDLDEFNANWYVSELFGVK
jgi:fused signal recognition particle receptor